MRTKPAIQRDLLGAAVLHVRGGHAASRSSLVAALGLAPSTIGLYVDQLIADGYINESGVARGPIGRPKRTLTTVADAGWLAGVEFNAERVQAVRVDFSGRLVAAQAKWLPEGSDARSVLQTIGAAVAALAKGSRVPLLAIGVGAPGVVDRASGMSTAYPYISGWERVPLADEVRRRFHVPVVVENNLRAVALAERWFGGGRALADYVILGPRAGFGVALVHAGRLLCGAHHAAGEIGRWVRPGAKVELQDSLSAPAVWRRLARAAEHAPPPGDLRAALAAFADAQGRIWDEIVTDYAQTVGTLQLLLDTEMFFLHGPLTALGHRFCNAIERTARAQIPALAQAALKIVPSTLGDDAGALGAASLAMETWAPPARREHHP